MRGELDLLVPPLRCAVVAGDQPHPMETAKVTVDKCVRVYLSGALGEAEMRARVLLQECAFRNAFCSRAWAAFLPREGAFGASITRFACLTAFLFTV